MNDKVENDPLRFKRANWLHQIGSKIVSRAGVRKNPKSVVERCVLVSHVSSST